MKKLMAAALFFLFSLPGYSQFQSTGEAYPECDYEYSCYYQKLGEAEKEKIEEQQEQQEEERAIKEEPEELEKKAEQPHN